MIEKTGKYEDILVDDTGEISGVHGSMVEGLQRYGERYGEFVVKGLE